MKKNQALLMIIEEVGSVSELAKLLDVSQPYVSNWLYGRRLVSATTQVKKLVELSKGKIKAKDLGPDVF